MVAKSDIALFWVNQSYFAGDKEWDFLDHIGLRNHLNRNPMFNGKAVSVLTSRDVIHWIFSLPYSGIEHCSGLRRGKKVIFDSYLNGHQPPSDCHCTMYTLYYQAYFSEYSLQLRPLKVVRTQLDYVDNLILIYNGLSKLFKTKHFVEYVHRYDWEGPQDGANKNTFILDFDLVSLLRENVAILRRYRREMIESSNFALRRKGLFTK